MSLDTAPVFRRSPFSVSTTTVGAVLKSSPEDFVVVERLRQAPTGSGQHVWLQVTKRGIDTRRVVQHLRRTLQLPQAAVGYAGLKDRHAVATQWFSVLLGEAAEPDWAACLPEGCELVESIRSQKKLRIGGLTGNRFIVWLRELKGAPEELERRLRRLAQAGFANYFGDQRFGSSGTNVERALALFRGEWRSRDKGQRGIYFSAARSHLFNVVLAERVARGNWDRVISGEVVMLEGSHSVFVPDAGDRTIAARIEALDLHPTGPMWGRGERGVTQDARILEDDVLAPFGELRIGLERAGLMHQRRALRAKVYELSWSLEAQPAGGRALRMSFELPAGSYATTVLEQLVEELEDRSRSGTAGVS